MPNIKHKYKDKEKASKAWMKQKLRYYERGREFASNNKQVYSEEEKQMILEHSKTDREIAIELGRSIQAIQLMRYRLKKGENGK